MAEPSPNPAQPVLESETPITNGTPAAADVEMADSAPMQEANTPIITS